MASSHEIKTSKFLSLVLRHHPESIGIHLDAQGWVDVKALLNAMGRHGHPMSESELGKLVDNNDKQRFAFNEDRTRIRANQGHSITALDLALVPKAPPEQLYHGTVQMFMDSIMAEGLKKMNRQYVHLSPDLATAQKVAQRRGKPVILLVATGRMQADGHVFYLSDNGVWLTDVVPPQYLAILSPAQSPARTG